MQAGFRSGTRRVPGNGLGLKDNSRSSIFSSRIHPTKDMVIHCRKRHPGRGFLSYRYAAPLRNDPELSEPSVRRWASAVRPLFGTARRQRNPFVHHASLIGLRQGIHHHQVSRTLGAVERNVEGGCSPDASSRPVGVDRRADGRCTFLSKRHDDQAAELLERVGAPTIAKIKEAFTRGAAVPRRRGDAVRDPPWTAWSCTPRLPSQ